MALTQAMLKAMGIEDDKREQILDAHMETLASIKAERDELRDMAAKVPELERQVEELEAAKPTEDWEAKYKAEHEALEAYKVQVEAEKAEAEKGVLYRSLLREAGIDEKRVDAIMKVTDLNGVVVEDGEISNAESVKQTIAEEWAAFIPQTNIQPAQVATPQASQQSSDGANPDVIKRLQERHERMYGTSEQQAE